MYNFYYTFVFSRNCHVNLNICNKMDFPGCIICHECFTGKGSIVSTPCGHLFDDKCIRDWLIAHPLCPTCRKPVTVSDLKRLHLSFFGLSESKERMQLEKAKLKEEMQKEELLELSGQFKKMLLSMNGVQKHVERISSENE